MNTLVTYAEKDAIEFLICAVLKVANVCNMKIQSPYLIIVLIIFNC